MDSFIVSLKKYYVNYVHNSDNIGPSIYCNIKWKMKKNCLYHHWWRWLGYFPILFLWRHTWTNRVPRTGTTGSYPPSLGALIYRFPGFILLIHFFHFFTIFIQHILVLFLFLLVEVFLCLCFIIASFFVSRPLLFYLNFIFFMRSEHFHISHLPSSVKIGLTNLSK